MSISLDGKPFVILCLMCKSVPMHCVKIWFVESITRQKPIPWPAFYSSSFIFALNTFKSLNSFLIIFCAILQSEDPLLASSSFLTSSTNPLLEYAVADAPRAKNLDGLQDLTDAATLSTSHDGYPKSSRTQICICAYCTRYLCCKGAVTQRLQILKLKYCLEDAVTQPPLMKTICIEWIPAETTSH